VDKDKFVFVCRPRKDECPRPAEQKEDAVLDLPVVSVDPPSPVAQTLATVTVAAPSASAITLSATGDGCGDFGVHTTAGGALSETRTVGAFGSCDLAAEADMPGGTQMFMGRFEVTPTGLTLPAVEVGSGTFVLGSLPAQTGGGSDPSIDSISGPGSLINGGTARLRITLVDPLQAGDVRRVQVQVEGAGGHPGFYEVPATLDGDTIVVDVTLSDVSSSSGAVGALHMPLEAMEITGVDLSVQLVDRFGSVGNRLLRHFDVASVGGGALQVSLSWDTPTDVDLHVVPPSGNEIYWANRTADGGELDLDSNAACSIDGVNNENITFADEAPVGEYVVRVDFWSDCGGLGANYTVTTRACGKVETFQGSFAPGTGDGGGAGSGVEIARFATGCTWRVRGTAMYEDFAQTTTGLAATSTMLPIRLAEVQVRRAFDGVILASGQTRQDGTFDVRFGNIGPFGYYVVVMAKQDSDAVKQAVRNEAGSVYAVRTPDVIVEPLEPDKTGLMITATRDNGAPAFNIFDAGVVGATFAKRLTGTIPPHVDWFWTSGEKGSCTGNVSCYQRSANTISVLSIPADRDEYDDLVLLHQYGHFLLSHYARSESPGGPHSVLSQVDPRVAWAEGGATFFGNAAKGTSLYIDTTAAGVGARLDIESLATAIPLGTSDGTQTGNISEAVVAAVLWDLLDATNEARDTLSMPAAVFGALEYLSGISFSDRGATGADMVDFLDGWFCKGHDTRGDATSGVQGNVLGLHNLNYDFVPVPYCP
jgi:hypothetical protein